MPLGYSSFSKIKNNDVIYIDKTDLICSIGKLKATSVFLSRPRRFGKSLLLSTFESLFSRGLKDFENLKIIENDVKSKDRFWHNEKTYKVIHLDFSPYTNDLESLKSGITIKLQYALMGKKLSELSETEKHNSPIDLLMSYKTENDAISEFVLLIDEYDSPISHSVDNPQKMKEMMDFISSFFAAIKSCERIFRFVCITGITRLAHVSLFSMFNNLEDITANDKYSSLLGITEDELHEYFGQYVQNAAAVLDMSVSDVYARLKSTYNGFQFTIGAQQTVYNPWSIISFLKKPEQGFSNYWYSTSGGVPTMLVKYLQQEENLELFNILRSKVASQNIEVEEDEDLWVDRDELMAKSEPDQIPIRMLL
ncbi:MAG: AAA family ATPase, partial [Succinivibrionaceae bacterium]|nr:AAA family ATPase [Succinivibrionaceae bacterium]